MRNNRIRHDYRLANKLTDKLCAVVVFGDDNSIPWSRCLDRGFRHCFIALACGSNWVIIDTLSNRIDITTIPLSSADALSAWYKRQGYQTIVTLQRSPPEKPAPWAMFTCVETIKRLLGIHRYGIQTPRQLWNFLKSENNP